MELLHEYPDATNTPPVIQVNGDNPAIIQVRDTYNDLGATITGPSQDLNLGIETYLNGSPMIPIISPVARWSDQSSCALR
jgi:hypothetical protein